MNTTSRPRPVCLPNLSGLNLKNPSSASTDLLATFRLDTDWHGGDYPANIRFDMIPRDEDSEPDLADEAKRQAADHHGNVKGDAFGKFEFIDGQEVIILNNGRVYDKRFLESMLRYKNTRFVPDPYMYELTNEELEELDFSPDEIASMDPQPELDQESDVDSEMEENTHEEVGEYDTLDGTLVTDDNFNFETVDEATREQLWKKELQRVEDRKEDMEEFMERVRENGMNLEGASRRARGNWDIVLSAVSQNGEALAFASGWMKNNKSIVRAAVGNDGNALAFASDNLKATKDIVLVAVKNDGGALLHASPELKDDYLVVLYAVTNNGMVLMYASERLRGKKRIVEIAVISAGRSLEYASDELRNDYNIVNESMMSLHDGAKSIEFASPLLKNNYELAMKAVSSPYGDGSNLKFVSPDMQDSEEVVMAALETNKKCLRYATPRLRQSLYKRYLDKEGYASARPYLVAFAPEDEREAIMRTLSMNQKEQTRALRVAYAANNYDATRDEIRMRYYS